MDKIYIEELQLLAIIGVYEWERQAPQRLLLDLVLHLPLQEAGKSDDLSHTVDYAKIAEAMENLCQIHQPQLLEFLAETMCAHILANFPVEKVEIKLSKPDILPKAKNVAVYLQREVNNG
ncbi:dihydroneopterin aldolase [Alteromonas sp. a30]|uniref:dihydroneopterin aldolase n=1 Tax=Alteromonas sp. a30 TaxID=2730917 RepID=UPI002281099F|nr:dihydroneopterin aldolase [Alteromonas sp. a30]MCY7296063.1 dihydroneopterin aldolase [Alteromonas sp. a30]